MEANRRKKVFWWILIAIWCSFIFLMSATPGDISSMESGAVVQLLNYIIKPFTGGNPVYIPSLLVRKAAHFTEYFILGMLLFNGFKNGRNLTGTFYRAAAFGVAYSMTDEFHQYFIPGRGAAIFDAGIDSMGVLTALIILFYINRRRAKAYPSR